ncbi:unnamed protein product [Peronospora destructor]|uniref:OPA3-like protein n=1 Tax=Peronospora destructor TaxID=86335 RepID=A0AAV0TUL8_9STRA|nr:unnamed protein product [Peronospora destructor]
MLPMIKLGGLVARTLTKPLARTIKARSKAHPFLNFACFRLGQQVHCITMKLHMGFRDISSYTIKPLPTDQAVEQGADLIGEIVVFSVALGVASLEYSRSAASTRAKEAKQKEQQLQEKREMEERFEFLENQVTWLEDQLEEVTNIVDNEIGVRVVELVVAEANRQKQKQSEARTLKLATRRQDQNIYVGLEIDEEKATEAIPYVVKLWKSTYDTVARLFK